MSIPCGLLKVFISEPALIAKSNIILDVKPWDDETDMTLMEEAVRAVSIDGLLWGACKYEMLSLQFCVPRWPLCSFIADINLLLRAIKFVIPLIGQ